MTVAITLEHRDYFSVHRSKRGRAMIIFTADNKKHIRSALNRLGYGCARLDGKNVFFFREEKKIKPITFFELRRAFGRYLMTLDLSGADISSNDVINEYHYQQPLRNSGLLQAALAGELTSKEQQQLRKELKDAAAVNNVKKKLTGNYQLAITPG